jgi:hypothetical protein
MIEYLKEEIYIETVLLKLNVLILGYQLQRKKVLPFIGESFSFVLLLF